MEHGFGVARHGAGGGTDFDAGKGLGMGSGILKWFEGLIASRPWDPGEFTGQCSGSVIYPRPQQLGLVCFCGFLSVAANGSSSLPLQVLPHGKVS